MSGLPVKSVTIRETGAILSEVNVQLNLSAEGFGNKLNSSALTVPASRQLMETLSVLAVADPHEFEATTRTLPEMLPQFTLIVPVPCPLTMLAPVGTVQL